jgi:hypothetical protein
LACRASVEKTGAGHFMELAADLQRDLKESAGQTAIDREQILINI